MEMQFTGLIMKTRCGYSNFREVPGPVLEILDGLAGLRSGNPFPSGYRHEDIAGEIVRSPTHLLVYDRHNRLLFVDTTRRLCLAPYDMGSDYDLPYPEARKLMKKVLKATAAGDIGTIDAVCVGSS